MGDRSIQECKALLIGLKAVFKAALERVRAETLFAKCCLALNAVREVDASSLKGIRAKYK